MEDRNISPILLHAVNLVRRELQRSTSSPRVLIKARNVGIASTNDLETASTCTVDRTQRVCIRTFEMGSALISKLHFRYL